MKKVKLIAMALLYSIGIVFLACDEELDSPEACYELSTFVEGETVQLSPPYTVEAGQEITFSNCGDADFYSFFSGVGSSSWTEYNEPANVAAQGSDTDPSGNVDFTYSEPGQYIATIVLTNRSIEDPSSYKQEILSFDITVTEATE